MRRERRLDGQPWVFWTDDEAIVRVAVEEEPVPTVILSQIGIDYKLTLSWLYRPTHPWQWPVRTATGWCLGRIGIHAKMKRQEILR